MNGVNNNMTDCTIMNNIKDNVSNSNNNEILFWKVINNKYLFRKIIHSIENDGQIIDTNERTKFKHIYSLDWMIENKQFQLLKCKLLNDNEYVDIDDFDCLLSLNISSCSGNNNNNNNTSSTSTPTSVIDIELFKEILQLVIKRIKQSYPQSSVTDKMVLFAFRYSSLQVINLIFQYIDNGTTLESTLVNSYNNSQSKDQFNSYLRCAVSNKHEGHTLLNIVLDIISKQGQLQQQHGSNSDNNITRLDIYIFLEIGNVDIQNIILDMDILEINNLSAYIITDYISELLDNSNDSIGLLLLGFKIYQQQQPQLVQLLRQQISVYQQQGVNESLIFKELFKQFIILSKSTRLFSIYLSKYNQVNQELMSISEFYIIALEYSTNHFIPDILNHLNGGFITVLFNSTRKEYISKEKPFVSDNLSRSIEFLKLYLSKLSPTTVTNNNNELPDFVLANTIKIIYDVVFEIQDSLQYEQFVNNEIPDTFKVYLPLKWDPVVDQLNSRYVKIKDIETIDWLKEWFSKSYESGSSYKRILNFDNVELSLYASNQLSLHIGDNKSQFYYTPCIKAIIEFNIQTIKYIHSLGITFSNYPIGKGDFIQLLSCTTLGYASIGNNTTGADINYQEFNEIIAYLVEHQMIATYSIFQLTGFIVENGYYKDSKYNNSTNNNELNKFDLEKVKINLVNQQSVIHNLFQVCDDYNHFRFLLENIKFTNLGQGDIIESMKFNDQHQDKTSLKISLIQLLLVQLKQCREIINKANGQTQQSLPNLRVYYRFLNSLFNSIVIDNDGGLKLEEIYQVHQLLIENQVELVFDNTIILGYLKCRSPILYRYLKHMSTISNTYIPLPQFEFSNSFDQLLEILIYRPYIDNQDEDYQNLDEENDDEYHYNNFIMTNLMFFMQIKRFDLYLKELNLIKNKLGITVLLSVKLIKECCINLELISITDTLKEIENTFNTNTKSKATLVKICSISLKLGEFKITKLALKTLIKFSNNNQIPVNDLIIKISNCDDINYILEKIYSIIDILDNIAY